MDAKRPNKLASKYLNLGVDNITVPDASQQIINFSEFHMQNPNHR